MNESETKQETEHSTVAFNIDSTGKVMSFTEFRNRIEKLALLQFMRLELEQLESDLREELGVSTGRYRSVY